MKTIFLTLLSLPLLAQTPIKFGATLQQGTTTIRCGLLDPAQLGGLFSLEKPNITCMLQSSDPDTDSFMVAIQTRGADGAIHTYTDKTGANGPFASPLLFDTDDQVLLSVVVAATSHQKVVEAGRFDGATAEAADALDDPAELYRAGPDADSTPGVEVYR